MPHGDFSDYAGFSHVAFGLASIFKPSLWWQSFGPIAPLLTGAQTPAALTAVRFAGGPLVFMGWTMYVVRWNVMNGKFAGGPACIACALNGAETGSWCCSRCCSRCCAWCCA